MNKNNFNKAEFAELLDKAKGDRSINKYAEQTNVSAAHISRFLRKMIDAPPSPETISKFSSKAYNKVTYKDFMLAAGHISISKEYECHSNKDISKTEEKLFQIILTYLYQAPFQWSMKKPDSKTKFPNMIIDIDDDIYKKWLLVFQAYPKNYSGTDFKVEYIYGKILMMKLTSLDKLSIIVNNKNIYKLFIKNPPFSLRANLYIMLVDIENNTILKEEKLSSYTLT